MTAISPFHLTVGLLFISTYGYLICLIRLASRKGYKKAVIAFVVYMVIALSNAGLSGSREHEIIHWIAEIVGIVSNTALVIGTREIYKKKLRRSLT